MDWFPRLRALSLDDSEVSEQNELRTLQGQLATTQEAILVLSKQLSDLKDQVDYSGASKTINILMRFDSFKLTEACHKAVVTDIQSSNCYLKVKDLQKINFQLVRMNNKILHKGIMVCFHCQKRIFRNKCLVKKM